MHSATKGRLLDDQEWDIAKDVFEDTLPFRWRIVVTDACGVGDAPFTIPAALLNPLNPLPIGGLIAASLSGVVAGLADRLGGAAGAVAAANGMISNVFGVLPSAHALTAPAQLSSIIAGAYLVNVGPRHFKSIAPSLLVHELTHVWQGRNGAFAMSYVINSAFHQCRGAAGPAAGRGAAYVYAPGRPWRTYNAEQQANIVEDWYMGGMPESGDLWPYIRTNIRNGFIGDHLPV